MSKNIKWTVSEFNLSGNLVGRKYLISADYYEAAINRVFEAAKNHSPLAYIGPSGEVVYDEKHLYVTSIAIDQDAREQASVEIPQCPKCEARSFHVTPTDLWEAGGVIACENCDALLSPQVGEVIDLIENKFGGLR